MKSTTGYYDPQRAAKLNIPPHEHLQAQQCHLPLQITSYKEALDWWKRRANIWPGTADRPVATDKDYNRRMKMLPDKSIVFSYYQQGDRVTWHPDNTLTLNPGTAAYLSGAFDRYVMPRQLEISAGARSGKVIMLRAAGDTGSNGQRDRITIEGVNGVETITNPATWVVRADGPVTLHKDEDGRWVPVNEYSVKPFYWYELDKGRLREASQKYNMPEFLAAIEAALSLGAEIKTYGSYANVDQRKNEGGEDILTLLEQGRFVEAAALVEAVEDRHYDVATQKYVTDTKHLRKGDIKKIRHTAYVEMGLVYLESERIVTLPQFKNIERKLLDFGVPAE